MPEILRWAVPAALVAAVLGTPVALWWERRRPSSFTHRPGRP